MSIVTAPITSLGAATLAVVEQAADMRAARSDLIPPGAYFGLSDTLYHADPALGSGDMKRLAYSPADYWFNSPLNPMREQEDSDKPALVFGRAVHTNVLEGRERFEAQYAPCEHPGNIKAGKEERAAIMADLKIPLKRSDYDRIQQAGAMIRANPHLKDAFSGGHSEVSVFWVDENGIRKKCRLDYLKVRSIVDLKSIRNTKSIGFADACRRAISDYRYDVQIEHYREGREALRRFVRSDDVRISNDYPLDVDPAWLESVASMDAPAWVFVFWQAEGAPLTWACSISPGNGIHDIARATIQKADQNFLDYSARFGLSEPWVLNQPIEELAVEDMPAWYGRT